MMIHLNSFAKNQVFGRFISRALLYKVAVLIALKKLRMS